MTDGSDRSSPAAIRAAIARLADGPPPLLVVVDFDGTLAVGSRDPAAARIEPAAQRGLRRLARLAADRPGRVTTAVLTGRTVEDAAARIRVGGIEYLGDHGLQQAAVARHGRPSRVRPRTDGRWHAHVGPSAVLADGVADDLGRPPWLFVERKGPSVAFHVRLAEDVVAARAAVLGAIERVERREGLQDHGLAHYRGRSVVDLRPVDAGGKREAVQGLIDRHRPGAVVALGDELSDVDAFDAVRAATAAGTIRVGLGVAVDAEGRPAPDELLAVSDLRLPSARRVGPFLLALGRALGGAPADRA